MPDTITFTEAETYADWLIDIIATIDTRYGVAGFDKLEENDVLCGEVWDWLPMYEAGINSIDAYRAIDFVVGFDI